MLIWWRLTEMLRGRSLGVEALRGCLCMLLPLLKMLFQPDGDFFCFRLPPFRLGSSITVWYLGGRFCGPPPVGVLVLVLVS